MLVLRNCYANPSSVSEVFRHCSLWSHHAGFDRQMSDFMNPCDALPHRVRSCASGCSDNSSMGTGTDAPNVKVVNFGFAISLYKFAHFCRQMTVGCV